MSILEEKNLKAVSQQIRKAKYRVKNAQGDYEIVYLETSADQVEETIDRVFVTPGEKSQITANQQAIAQEVQDRTQAVNAVDTKVDNEITRATDAEAALGQRIDDVEADVLNTKNLVDTKTAQALQDAKDYTNAEIVKVNGANSALDTKVDALEKEFALVDGKIDTAKTEAIDAAEAHTNSEISRVEREYQAADTQVLNDAKAHAESKVQELKTNLEVSINNVDAKVNSAKADLENSINTLEGRVTTNETDIQNLKNAVSNKNSNTIVVSTEDEIAIENPTPKVGDLAYVISSKRAYIYKGTTKSTAAAGEFKAGETVVGADLITRIVPTGWVVFDEITSELDLVDYLKKDEAEATYRKLSEKIAEVDLEAGLATKINEKADKSYVDGQLADKATEAYVDAAVNPVKAESAQNKLDIAQEVKDREAEITRVEGLISNASADYKAEDAKINNRIDKFAPVIDSIEPQGTEAGHVWLELV